MTKILKTVITSLLMFGVCTSTVMADDIRLQTGSRAGVQDILSIPNTFTESVVSAKKKTSNIVHDIPSIDSTFKAFMDFRKITDITSTQWELQQKAYTDKQGMRKIEGLYCVAMGTYYSVKCGDKFQITLASGKEFGVIVSDIKDDRHTDNTHMYTPLKDGEENIYNDNDVQMGNIIEFIVDDKILSHEVKNVYGSVSSLGFEGNITEIVEVLTDGED